MGDQETILVAHKSLRDETNQTGSLSTVGVCTTPLAMPSWVAPAWGHKILPSSRIPNRFDLLQKVRK
jgi:hypothetical protein